MARAKRKQTPLLSMTGFGAGSARAGGYRAEVELRAVNGRYLSLKAHLAGEYAFLEEPLRARLEPELGRGSVELWAEVRPERAEEAAPLDEERVRAYAAAWQRVARKLKLPGELRLETLAAQPDMFLATTDRKARARAEAALLVAAETALDKLQAMRAREGAALARTLAAHLDAIEALRGQIVERGPSASRQLVERAAARVRKLLESGAAGPAGAAPAAAPRPEDIARELAWWADRCDIAEEMQRLESHLGQFRAALTSSGAVGKRLDFLVQELHREANTAGSKSADTEISGLVLEMKTVIEKLREQVQNVL